MYLLRNILHALMISSCLTVVAAQPGLAMDPRFELDSKELSGTRNSAAKTEKRSARKASVKSHDTDGSGSTVHTVRAGDNIFKILMRNYKLSNDEAESFIEEIRRENNIYDIKRLKVGQKITIPAVRRKADGSLKIAPVVPVQSPSSSPSQQVQSFRLDSPLAALTEQDAGARVRKAWDAIIPAPHEEQKPISLNSATFSLTLDPLRYPVYAAADGGKILVDQNATIPPLVRSLITEKDPSIRIVSASPANARQFLTAMLGSAGFYSLEENFSMDFGTDPKLTVHADFKIEKTKDSLVKQDIVLMNAGRETLAPAIGELLKKEGFTLYEPYASQKTITVGAPRQMHQITAKQQPAIVDALLASLAINPASERQMDVFAADNNGISLSVKAERYFERNGKRFVVTRFDGDPITYTLFRILETKGYQVVILDKQDDFKKISEKLITRLSLQGTYRQHTLVKNPGGNYTLQMSGFMLEGSGMPTGGVFVTNLEFDRMFHDILTENGYTITTK